MMINLRWFVNERKRFWRALLTFLSGAVKRSIPEIDEAKIKDQHAKIGELAVANDFLSRKLKPLTGK